MKPAVDKTRPLLPPASLFLSAKTALRNKRFPRIILPSGNAAGQSRHDNFNGQPTQNWPSDNRLDQAPDRACKSLSRSSKCCSWSRAPGVVKPA